MLFGWFAKAKPFARFIRSERGNVLPLFALAIIPVFGLVGVAVDYSRAGTMRSEIQAALDATALMMSKESKGLTPDQIATKANTYFTAILNRPDAPTITLTPTFTTVQAGSYTLKIDASASIDTTFARILGQDKIAIGSSSEVSWGVKRLDLVMALDNTGSMSSNNKMTELKKAAKSLLDTLFKAAGKKDDIKVAVVPFTTDVNIGMSYVNATWLDWSDWDSKNGSCDKYKKNLWQGRSPPSDKSTCEDYSGTWTSSSHSNWSGCVWDRQQDYDTDDTTPSSTATKFQPHETSYCPPATLMPLSDITTNWVSSDLTASNPTSALGKKINSMTPNGNTNVTIGAAWGWHALTSSDPLTEASAPAADLDKVLILLTDGDNTQNRFSSNQSSIDARTKKVCDNIKATNVIKIYTVRVIDGNASLLQNCASRMDMYYDVQNSSQLNTVFTTIAQNLANLRISK
ncbi:MAG: pilus assembly protein [Rhizobiales bacterium]|nr:pilus assembly protein [Hyphomicrobiales bacterium]